MTRTKVGHSESASILVEKDDTYVYVSQGVEDVVLGESDVRWLIGMLQRCLPQAAPAPTRCPRCKVDLRQRAGRECLCDACPHCGKFAPCAYVERSERDGKIACHNARGYLQGLSNGLKLIGRCA